MMIVPRLKQASKNLKAAVHKAKNIGSNFYAHHGIQTLKQNQLGME